MVFFHRKRYTRTKEGDLVIKTDFLPGTNLQFIQRKEMFRFNSDTVALCRFMKVRAKDRILDIGTNNGVLLVYALKQGGSEGIGIDLFSEAIDLAKRNASLNQVDNATFRVCPLESFSDGTFDLILCNPPYFKEGSDKGSNPYLNAARHESSLTLDELAKHAFRLLREHGRLALVHRSSRTAELIRVLESYRFAIKRIRFIHDDVDAASSGILIEALKNGNDGCIVEAPDVLRKGEKI